MSKGCLLASIVWNSGKKYMNALKEPCRDRFRSQNIQELLPLKLLSELLE